MSTLGAERRCIGQSPVRARKLLHRCRAGSWRMIAMEILVELGKRLCVRLDDHSASAHMATAIEVRRKDEPTRSMMPVSCVKEC